MTDMNIKAQVMYDWNRETNPGCKFLPGDVVKVHSTHDMGICNSDRVIKAKLKSVGEIVAVSAWSPECQLIRNPAGTRPYRYWTAYYVKFADGSIHGYRSEFISKYHEPKQVENYAMIDGVKYRLVKA